MNRTNIKKSNKESKDKLIERLEKFYNTSIDKIKVEKQEEVDFGRPVGAEILD